MDNNNENKVLFYLDELSDYKVASEYSDVRGWKVLDPDNRTVGEVDNLLVNKNTEQVVYLDVEIDDDLLKEGRRTFDRPAIEGTHVFLNKDGENHLIIPVGTVEIDKENRMVKTRDIGYDKFIKTKWISKGAPIDRDFEENTFKNYFPDGTQDESRMDPNNFYNRREFLGGTSSSPRA